MEFIIRRLIIINYEDFKLKSEIRFIKGLNNNRICIKHKIFYKDKCYYYFNKNIFNYKFCEMYYINKLNTNKEKIKEILIKEAIKEKSNEEILLEYVMIETLCSEEEEYQLEDWIDNMFTLILA